MPSCSLQKLTENFEEEILDYIEEHHRDDIIAIVNGDPSTGTDKVAMKVQKRFPDQFGEDIEELVKRCVEYEASGEREAVQDYEEWEAERKYFPLEENMSTAELKENNKKRLELRKQLNEHTFSAIDNKRLQEEMKDEDSQINLVRYQLQDFHNGKGDGTDGKSGYDGPSDYEAWRKGINDKKRKARAEQENADRESPFASPKTTTIGDSKLLDGQIDDFLMWWMDKQKNG